MIKFIQVYTPTSALESEEIEAFKENVQEALEDGESGKPIII